MVLVRFLQLVAGAVLLVLLAFFAADVNAQQQAPPAEEPAIVEEEHNAHDPQFEEEWMLMDSDGWVYEGEQTDNCYDYWYAATVQKQILKGGTYVYPEGWWYYIPDGGSYYYYESVGRIEAGIDNAIYYDYCEMERLGAGNNDYWTLYNHERAHARGLDHYEGTPATNAAYYPTFEITGY